MEVANKLSLPRLFDEFLRYSFDEDTYSQIIDTWKMKEKSNSTEKFYTGYRALTPDDDFDLLMKYRTRYLTNYENRGNGSRISIKQTGYVAKRSNKVIYVETLYELESASDSLLNEITDYFTRNLMIDGASETNLSLSDVELSVELLQESNKLTIKLKGNPKNVEKIITEITRRVISTYQQPFQIL